MWPTVGRYAQTVTALKLQATLTKYWVTDKLLLDSLETFLRSLPAALLAPFFISLVILLSKINLWKTLCHNYQTFLNGTSFFERLSCDPPK